MMCYCRSNNVCFYSYAKQFLVIQQAEEQIQASQLPEDVTAKFSMDQDDSDDDLAVKSSKSKPKAKSRKKSSFVLDLESDPGSSKESMDSADDVASIDDEDNDKHDKYSTTDNNNNDSNGDVESPSCSDTNPEPEASHEASDTGGIESSHSGANPEPEALHEAADTAGIESPSTGGEFCYF
jgi:hypothetical protein